MDDSKSIRRLPNIEAQTTNLLFCILSVSHSISAMSNSQPQPHILVFPFPAQGHMIPMLDMAHRLAARGFSITVLVTPKLRPLLDPFLSAATGDVHTLVLPLPPHPALPPGVEQVRDLPQLTLSAALMQALAGLRPEIVTWARSHPNPPSIILSEFFLGWTHHLADDLAVPHLAFYSSNALLASVLDRLFRHRPARPESDDDLVPLPGLPSFPYAHLPSMYHRYSDAVAGGAASPDWEFARDAMLANASCWGAVFNTFDALERPHIARLRDEFGHPRVWAVGPILPAVPADGRGGLSSVPLDEVSSWLETCPTNSVVYVCFGSQFWPTVEQGRALAAGLELSGARFVWAVGSDRADGGTGAGAGAGAVVPEGFERRTAGRGLVIRGWAPQTAILGHVAVGAFLTHCGWNSVLEGIAAGVTLLAWPMQADQFVNARLLVEETGVAVRACEGGGTVPDTAVLARVLAESVTEGTWPEIRARAAEMGRKAHEALGEGGTSFTDLEELAKELRELSMSVSK